MTLDLTARYPSQVITTDPEYPLGKARNRTAPGDGTGTPFEQDLVNDWLGATQALLDAGGITASGDPDKVGVSDVVDAVRALATRPAATYALNAGSAIPCTMTQISASPGFTLITGTQIEVPSAGKYLVSWGAAMETTSTANKPYLAIALVVNATKQARASGVRWSIEPTEFIIVSRSHVVTVADPATDRIIFLPESSVGGTTSINDVEGIHDDVVSIVKL